MVERFSLFELSYRGAVTFAADVALPATDDTTAFVATFIVPCSRSRRRQRPTARRFPTARGAEDMGRG